MRIRLLFFTTLVFFALCGSTFAGQFNKAGVPAGLEEVYALVRQKALSINQ
jgi:hypothetical protein